MNNEECLQNLKSKYPGLYDELHYLEIFEGWFSLIEELSEKLYNHYLTLDNKEEIRIVQIKQKFGGLRFYISYGDNIIYDMIREAEKKSFSTCEFCGKFSSGPKSINYWIMTLCDAHREEREKMSGRIA